MRELAERTTKATGGIRDMIAKVSESTASSVGEQLAARTLLAKNIENVAQMAGETAATVWSTSSTDGDLTQLADQLKQTADRFRLS